MARVTVWWVPERKFALSVLLLALLFAAAVYHLFYANHVPAETPFRYDIAAIRAQAGAVEDGPVRIEIETVNTTHVPRIAMVAGTDWGPLEQVRVSYRLIYADGTSVIIDTAQDAASARAADVEKYDSAAWGRMCAGLAAATQIVVTHEHPDHIGGLLSCPGAAMNISKARLNQAQFEGQARSLPAQWPAGTRQNFAPMRATPLNALAPGVVVIAARGHTPGSQMVYVRRADAQEYIFMGDTASNADNVRLLRIRSHYVTDWLGGDDRSRVMMLTMALNRLAQQEPNIALVPGHDAAAIADMTRAGLFTRQFHLN